MTKQEFDDIRHKLAKIFNGCVEENKEPVPHKQEPEKKNNGEPKVKVILASMDELNALLFCGISLEKALETLSQSATEKVDLDEPTCCADCLHDNDEEQSANSTLSENTIEILERYEDDVAPDYLLTERQEINDQFDVLEASIGVALKNTETVEEARELGYAINTRIQYLLEQLEFARYLAERNK